MIETSTVCFACTYPSKSILLHLSLNGCGSEIGRAESGYLVDFRFFLTTKLKFCIKEKMFFFATVNTYKLMKSRIKII